MVEDSAEKITAEEYVRQKRNWENELERIRSLLHNTQMVIKLDLIHKSKVKSSCIYDTILHGCLNMNSESFSFLATRGECRRSF